MQRTNDRGWNEVVSWMTRGMLYGHEVEKPQWYRTVRKNARSRQLNRAAPRREAVMELLEDGRTVEEIARELWMRKSKVDEAVGHICRQEGVKNRAELGKKLGWKREQPLNVFQKRRALKAEREEKILALLVEGLAYKEIGVRIGVSEDYVSRAAARIYAKHGVGRRVGRRGLEAKLGVGIGGSLGIEREVRERLLAGESYREIMEGMGMSKAAVTGQCVKIYKREGVRRREELREKYARDQKSEVRSQVLQIK